MVEPSKDASGDLHGLFSFRLGQQRSGRNQILKHTKLILAIFAGKFHQVHTLPDEMEAQAPGTKILQRTPFQFSGVRGRTRIQQK